MNTYKIVCWRDFRARQGIIAKEKLPLVPEPDDGYLFELRVEVGFTTQQLSDKNMFIDQIQIHAVLDAILSDITPQKPWADYFSFRPTLEAMTKHIYDTIETRIPQVAQVTLVNKTRQFSVTYCN